MEAFLSGIDKEEKELSIDSELDEIREWFRGLEVCCVARTGICICKAQSWIASQDTDYLN
jgi:hypothetical protein